MNLRDKKKQIHNVSNPSYTIVFSKCFRGLEALGFAKLIGSDHNNSVSILQEINENTIMAPRQEGLLEQTEEESIRVSPTG
jgi:hypothetical protein